MANKMIVRGQIDGGVLVEFVPEQVEVCVPPQPVEVSPRPQPVRYSEPGPDALAVGMGMVLGLLGSIVEAVFSGGGYPESEYVPPPPRSLPPRPTPPRAATVRPVVQACPMEGAVIARQEHDGFHFHVHCPVCGWTDGGLRGCYAKSGVVSGGFWCPRCKVQRTYRIGVGRG